MRDIDIIKAYAAQSGHDFSDMYLDYKSESKKNQQAFIAQIGQQIEQEQVSQEPNPQQIIMEVAQALQQGVEPEAIAQELMQMGLNEQEVAEVFNVVGQMMQQQEGQEQEQQMSEPSQMPEEGQMMQSQMRNGGIPSFSEGYRVLDPVQYPAVHIPSNNISMDGIDFDIDAYSPKGKYYGRMKADSGEYNFPTDIIEKPIIAQTVGDLRKLLEQAINKTKSNKFNYKGQVVERFKNSMISDVQRYINLIEKTNDPQKVKEYKNRIDKQIFYIENVNENNVPTPNNYYRGMPLYVDVNSIGKSAKNLNNGLNRTQSSNSNNSTSVNSTSTNKNYKISANAIVDPKTGKIIGHRQYDGPTKPVYDFNTGRVVSFTQDDSKSQSKSDRRFSSGKNTKPLGKPSVTKSTAAFKPDEIYIDPGTAVAPIVEDTPTVERNPYQSFQDKVLSDPFTNGQAISSSNTDFSSNSISPSNTSSSDRVFRGLTLRRPFWMGKTVGPVQTEFNNQFYQQSVNTPLLDPEIGASKIRSYTNSLINRLNLNNATSAAIAGDIYNKSVDRLSNYYNDVTMKNQQIMANNNQRNASTLYNNQVSNNTRDLGYYDRYLASVANRDLAIDTNLNSSLQSLDMMRTRQDQIAALEARGAVNKSSFLDKLMGRTKLDLQEFYKNQMSDYNSLIG